MPAALAWAYAGHFGALGVAFFAAMVIARILSPQELGIYAFAGALTGVFSILPAVIAPYIIRETNLSPSATATAFTVNSAVNLGLSLLTLAMAAIVGPLFHSRAAAPLLMVLAVSPAFAVFEFLPATLSAREMRFQIVAGATILKSVVGAAVGVFLALRGWSALSLAIAVAASSATGAVAYNLAAPRFASLRLSLVCWREITGFGIQIASVSGVTVVVGRLSEILLGRTLGLAALGLFSRASGLSSIVWETYGMATRVVFVRLSAEQNDPERMRQTFLRSSRMITAVMWPATLGLALLSAPFIRLVFGERWLGAAGPLSILMLAQFVSIGFGMNWELCVIRRRTGWQARVEFARAAAGLAAFAIGSLFNLLLATSGRLVESLVGFLVYRPRMDEMIGAAPGTLRGVYSESLLLALVATSPAALLMGIRRGAENTDPILALGAIAIGAGAWVLMLLRRDHPLAEEARLIWHRVAGGADAGK